MSLEKCGKWVDGVLVEPTPEYLAEQVARDAAFRKVKETIEAENKALAALVKAEMAKQAGGK